MLWTSNICRICARISEICIPIFQECTTSSLEAKIRRCLNTIIANDDLKPKQVCQECFMKLNEFYEFIVLYHDSNYRFETLLYQSSQGTASNLPLQDCIDRNMLPLVDQTKSEALPECPNLDLTVEYKDEILPLENLDVQARDFGEANILNEIVEQVNDVDINMQNFVCSNEQQIYGTENLTALKSTDHNYLGKLHHLQSYLDGEGADDGYVKPLEVMIKTDVQNNSFDESVYAETGTINNNNINYKDSRMRSSSISRKSNNKLTIISVETVHKAADCDKHFKDSAQLNKNKRINGTGKVEHFEHNILNRIANENQEIDIDSIDVENLVADNQINNMDYLNLQQNIKTNENKKVDPLALDDPGGCYKQNFSSQNIVINNNCSEVKVKNKKRILNIISVATIRKMIENRPQVEIIPRRRMGKLKKGEVKSKTRFPCNTCGKTFGRRQHFNEHMKKHNNIRPYICEICDKTFAVQWDLTFHKRVHTDLYSCEHCTKCFSAPSKLERHIRTHTGERPFVCPVEKCGRSFSDKRNLIGHEITHTNIRKFTCDICKRSYKTKSQLKDHMQAHSECPAFKCINCDKSYKWKTNLLMHMKKNECENYTNKLLTTMMHRKECKKETTT